MSTATLAGLRVTHAHVHLPAFGVWWAVASLDEEATLTGRVSLKIADLTLSGSIMSGGPGPKGRSSFRIAGAAGAWGRDVPAVSYANDAGVKAATVLADAATACGETIDPATLPAARLGPAFAREAGPAARVLELVVPANWYVGEDGVTRIGRRRAAALTTPADIGSVDRARGVVELAAASIATVVPGVVVEGVEAVDVLHELEPGALRTTLWGSGIAGTSRRLVALRRIFEQLDPRAKYRGVFEYRVVTQSGERVSLQPIRVSVGMPDLQRVPVRPGLAGTRADLALGSRVLVGFVDADPARPVVVGFEDAEGAGFVPSEISIGAVSGAPLAARQGDTVKVLLPPAVFSGVIGVAPATGVLTFPTGFALGTIETGSSFVRIAS
jgi:hypothetical protein